ncbi:MAG: hypothetical protein Q9166_004280 [cf. Caloplaca sp. 2 TL-2023]
MIAFGLGKDSLLIGAKSPWSHVFRASITVLVCGLLYETWSLHTYYTTRTQSRTIHSLITSRLDQLALVYKEQAVFNAHHLDLGPTVRLANYTDLLRKASQDAFSSTTTSRLPPKLQKTVASARSAIDLASENGWTPQEIPHMITTSVRNLPQVPREFHTWKKQNPDWVIRRLDEKAIDIWLKGRSGLDKTVILQVYKRLPRWILKSDLFRYLMIFLEGGVYTDPDTSCILPIAEWGQKGTTTDMTDFRLLQLVSEAQDLIRGHAPHQKIPPLNEAPPALIVAVETVTTREDSEGGHFAQYAFASAPGHPMFLDLIQHVVEVSRAMEDLRAAGDMRTWNSDQVVFTWTGAEIWSSAVWRYLWARWGFDSRRLHGINHPVRVGDVLILPSEAFRASSSDPSQQESSEACLWHGFHPN